MEQLSSLSEYKPTGTPTKNWGRPSAVILIAENPSSAAPPASRDDNSVKQLQIDVCCRNRAHTPDEMEEETT